MTRSADKAPKRRGLPPTYAVDDLPGRLVVAVMNFPPKRIASVKSEVLVLGALDDESATILVRPDREVRLGTRIL